MVGEPRNRPHRDIARWLNREQGVDGWWAQEITVAYERAIGRRQTGQRPDGYAISASKTVAVPVDRFFAGALRSDDRETERARGLTESHVVGDDRQ